MLEMITRFRRSEEGSISIGLLFTVPILVWVLLSTFVFFDAYRAEAISERAGLTIADMFSREELPITPEYLDNTQKLLRAITEFDIDPDFRVTAYQYFDEDNGYRVIWSEHRGEDFISNYDDESFKAVANRVPQLANGEISLLIETQSQYTAPLRQSIITFGIGNLTQVEFDTFVFIRPRPALVCWDADVV